MHIDYLHSFIETVKQKSLSKASERLNLSQPALSKQIRRIEEYFDTVLLKRSASGVELTKAGELFYGRIPKILDEWSSLQNDLNEFNQRQTYIFGTLPSLASNFLPSIILKLKEKGMATEVLVKNTSSEVFELLKKGEIDAAIIEEMPINRGYWQKKIFDEPFYAVVHQSHLFSNYESIRVEEVLDEDFIMYPPNCMIRKSVEQIAGKIKVKTEVGFGEHLIGYVAAGGGITIVPKITAMHLGYTTVKAIPIKNENFIRNITIITQSNLLGKLLYPFFKEA